MISLITEQDRGLEQISAALRRQQKMGYAIQDEVGEHNGNKLDRNNHIYLIDICNMASFTHTPTFIIILDIVIIDDISAGTSRADTRIRRETQRIEETRRKEKTYCTCSKYCTCIA